jgi:hypothetical protein
MSSHCESLLQLRTVPFRNLKHWWPRRRPSARPSGRLIARMIGDSEKLSRQPLAKTKVRGAMIGDVYVVRCGQSEVPSKLALQGRSLRALFIELLAIRTEEYASSNES